MNQSNREIKFFGIGPQRTASSWLDFMLREHDGIALPHQVKETMFFDQRYAKGMDWYLHHFNQAGDRICGEIAPTYFDSKEALENVHRHYPNAKIIINVRNPIARCHSLFRHHLSKGRVPNDFAQALKKMPRILESGHYQQYCEAWEKQFDGNVIYLVQEDIESEPLSVMQDVCEFIGAAPMENKPEFANEKINSATAPKSIVVAKVLSTTATLLRSLRLHSLVNAGKNLGLKKAYQGGKTPAPLTPENVEFLSEYFNKDITWLENRLNRDFQSWLIPPAPNPDQAS